MADEDGSGPDATDTAQTAVSEAAKRLVFTIEASHVGARVDAVLAELSGVSRAQVKRWIQAGRVRIDDVPVRASRRLELAETVEAWPLETVPLSLAPEPIPLVVLFEDEDLIVIDKPGGLVVHPAPGHPSGTLVNALLHHCGDLAGIGGVLRPGIVHRLDRGTSGVLVAAKSDRAHQALARQFETHSIERVYRALVRGLPRDDEGVVDRPVGRHPTDRKRMSVETRAGRTALTRWRVVRRFRAANTSELEIRPETGRTHQIRVHLASAGLPLVGDVVYGRARGADAALGRPALHAARLGFDHPRTGRRMVFDAPLPEDLLAWMADLGPGEPVTRPDEVDG